MSPVDPCSASELYYENLTVGQVFRSGTVEVTLAEITAFAARYDPQPFHLDPVAARTSVFGELVASGWLTAALTIYLPIIFISPLILKARCMSHHGLKT